MKEVVKFEVSYRNLPMNLLSRLATAQHLRTEYKQCINMGKSRVPHTSTASNPHGIK